MVSHLQKDLQTEKQDKLHIQQELNDALTILNKPTAEMGTQTDLTVEQITQMERDLEYQRKLLYQGFQEIEKLEEELSREQIKNQKEIENLELTVKKLSSDSLNQEEKDLINIFRQTTI